MNLLISNSQLKDDLEGLTYKKYSNSMFSKFTHLLHLSSFCNCLCTLITILFLLFIVIMCKTYIRALLIWISFQDPYLVNILMILLFTLVSFPFLWGYMLLVLSSGYLFGFIHGVLTVILSANIGVAIAHYTIKAFHRRYPVEKLCQNENAQAVLRVIAGPQAFKIVMFCRLSPIPFGLQNTIFGISKIASSKFHPATFIGLLPTQCLATYLGSTLRSMEDVLSDHSNHATGIIVLCIQILFGITLLIYVIHKAKQELKTALTNDIESRSSSESSLSSLSSITIS